MLAARHRTLPWGGIGFAFAAAVLYWFHDRFWWGPDDGAYGYAAQRMLAGDVQNGNLQELHPGYIGFLHVAAFRLFGEDLLSLRYPLVAASLAQVMAGWWLLVPRGPAYAAAGAVVLTALSCIQFLNPSPNWYATAMAFWVVVTLARRPAGDPGRDVLIGGLIVATFMMRQLSGVLLAMGALTWMLSERREGGGRPRLARVLLAVMAAGLCAYLWRNGSAGGVLLFGLWALAALALAGARTRLSDTEVLRLAGRMLLGGMLIILPLIGYHAWHGSFGTLYEDTVLAVLHLTELDYQSVRRHWIYGLLALAAVLSPPDAAAAASGLFWLVLLALPPGLGLYFALAARPGGEEAVWHPLPVIAVFFALVATPFEIPIYLTYTSGLSALALMWLAGRSRGGRIGFGAAALAIAAIGIGLHAAQPLSRGLKGIAEGRRIALDAQGSLPRVSLRIEERERAMYEEVLAAIEAAAPAGAPILAMPANPELLFMSGRPSLYRFYITATGIRDPSALAAAIAAFDRAPPPIVIHDPTDKFNNWASEGLLAHVRARYVLDRTVAGRFDIYLPR